MRGTFADWMWAVDTFMVKLMGVTSRELRGTHPIQHFYQLWQTGCSASSAAREALGMDNG